jgi:aryl-phospho-beta-D-glucosidase BglC (GH1 family)
MWAKRFKNVSSDKISFDLLNEPALREDMNDQHSKNSNVPGKLYREIAKNAADRIRSVNPNHLIIADGNNVGNDIIPEIEDLNIAQSCRGYFPHYISHHKALGHSRNGEISIPVWPGTMDNRYFRKEDLENYYKPGSNFQKEA